MVDAAALLSFAMGAERSGRACGSEMKNTGRDIPVGIISGKLGVA